MRIFVVVLALVALPAIAQTEDPQPRHRSIPREAWEWSDADRIAVRLDPAKARERLVANTVASTEGTAKKTARWVDVINGHRNPELFLPTELFDGLIRRGFVTEEWRDDYVTQIRKIGFPADFWDRLAVVASDFIADRRQQEDLLIRRKTATPEERALIDGQLTALQPMLCRHRADALARARAEFGPALDRFLYETLAPEATSYFDAPELPWVLHAQVSGCR